MLQGKAGAGKNPKRYKKKGTERATEGESDISKDVARLVERKRDDGVGELTPGVASNQRVVGGVRKNPRGTHTKIQAYGWRFGQRGAD